MCRRGRAWGWGPRRPTPVFANVRSLEKAMVASTCLAVGVTGLEGPPNWSAWPRWIASPFGPSPARRTGFPHSCVRNYLRITPGVATGGTSPHLHASPNSGRRAKRRCLLRWPLSEPPGESDSGEACRHHSGFSCGQTGADERRQGGSGANSAAVAGWVCRRHIDSESSRTQRWAGRRQSAEEPGFDQAHRGVHARESIGRYLPRSAARLAARL